MKFIYLIKNIENSYYKIGIAKNPQKRLNELQTGNSSKLIIIETYKSEFARKIETTLHNRYSFLKKEGEWFDFSIKEQQQFLNECRKIEETFKFLKENNNVFI